ncbi:MAG TPA: PAS domain S-box protein [Bacteroidales bacterium]|nr:PAS domain S-box protein [Bacteroidales bacterium]
MPESSEFQRKKTRTLENAADKFMPDIVSAFKQLQRENEELKERLKRFEGKDQLQGQVTDYRTQATFFNSRILDFFPQKIYIKDRDSRYITCNKAFAVDCGISIEEIAGKTDFDLYPPEQADSCKADDKQIMESAIMKDLIEKQMVQNTERWFHKVKAPFFDVQNKIAGIVGIYEDITEQKEALEELRKSQENLSVTLNSIGDGVIATDLSGFVVNMNPVAENLCGWTLNEAIGRPLMEIFCIVNADTRKAAENPIRKVVTTGKVVGLSNHTVLISKNGAEYNIADSAAPILGIGGEIEGVVMVFSDVTERYQKAQALAESEKKLRYIIENSTNTFYSHDINGNGIYYSPQIKNLLGYEVAEAMGNWTKFLSDNPINNLGLESTQRAIETGQPQPPYELELIHKNGSRVWVEINEAPVVEDAKVVAIVGSNTDITERKKAEEDLKERERIFATLVASLPGMAYRQAFDRHWTTHFISQACYTITGYQPEDLIDNKTISYNDIILEEFHQPIWEKWQYVVAEKKVFEHEYKIRKSNGEIRWVWERGQPVYDNKGQVLYLEGYIEDITERKTAQEEIIRNRDRLLTFFEEDISADYISSPDGMLFLCNDTYLKLFGFSSKEEAYKTSVSELYKNKSHREIFLSELKKLGKVSNYELDFVSRQGANIHAVINASGEFDYKGNLIQIRGYINDITVQKRIMEQLILAKEKAEESNKLKTAFLANMSHEIRTPMNGILGFSDLLKEPDLTDSEKQIFIDIIRKSGQRLLKTVNDLIDVSKVEAGIMDLELSTVNINDQLVELYNFFKPEIERKRLEISYFAPLPNDQANIVTDNLKFHAVLSNLLQNAVKFTQKGYVQIGYERTSETLTFYVKDSGVGIPLHRQQAIFERFVQADSENRQAYQGAGLGLAIAKSYVEMMGGAIWVESKPGKGSTFYFNLPVKGVPLPNIAQKKSSRKKRSNFDLKLKVLIADDDSATVSLLERTLKPMAKEILSASNGKETVELALENPDVDLILMDISMPEMNGYEATRYIREFNKDVIIIAQTAFALHGDPGKAIEAGCNGHVSKPIELEGLKSLILQCIDDKSH